MDLLTFTSSFPGSVYFKLYKLSGGKLYLICRGFWVGASGKVEMESLNAYVVKEITYW